MKRRFFELRACPDVTSGMARTARMDEGAHRVRGKLHHEEKKFATKKHRMRNGNESLAFPWLPRGGDDEIEDFQLLTFLQGDSMSAFIDSNH
ncbi:hypothetical protein QQ054_31895 [Oscillatoria amoena NRMC-F 0135]|nr:hypothetical protein [Oscillatoria amoena NRMC-F 0135]